MEKWLVFILQLAGAETAVLFQKYLFLSETNLRKILKLFL